MKVSVVNRQRRDPVPLAWLSRLARHAVQELQLTQTGRFPITLLDRRTMTRLNRRFTRRNRLTDVLSFRYPDEPIVGELLIAPAAARAYTRAHGGSYRLELARYVIHGLLHWVGHEDRTAAQQRRMHRMEDQLLQECVGRNGRGRGQETGGGGRVHAPCPTPRAPR